MTTPDPAVTGAIKRLAFASTVLQEQLRTLDQLYDESLDVLAAGTGICQVLLQVPVASRLDALDVAFTEFFTARRACRRVVIEAAMSDGADMVELARYFSIPPGLVAAYSVPHRADHGD
jgi:hypothetical protein